MSKLELDEKVNLVFCDLNLYSEYLLINISASLTNIGGVTYPTYSFLFSSFKYYLKF